MANMSTQTGEFSATGAALQFLDERMRDCIAACIDCGTICLATVSHCLEKGGKHAEPSHIRLLLDCAEICQTSANFMTRRSELHARTCSTCAEVCDDCATGCEQMTGDPQMKACAEACRRCAESCRRMAAS